MSISPSGVMITDNIDLLSEYQSKGIPCILLLNDKNRDKDTSKARYCALLDKEDELRIGNAKDRADRQEILSEVLGKDYINLVIARSKNEPLVIMRSERIVIREFTSFDADDICKLYDEAGDSLEPFFDNKAEAGSVIEKYIHDVYDFYGYGLWAIELVENHEFIGIVGFTPRDSFGDNPNIELGYAINKKHQRKGYAFLAATMAIEYASQNIDYEKILINVNNDNIPGQILGEKLRVFSSDVYYTIMNRRD